MSAERSNIFPKLIFRLLQFERQLVLQKSLERIRRFTIINSENRFAEFLSGRVPDLSSITGELFNIHQILVFGQGDFRLKHFDRRGALESGSAYQS